MPSYERLSERLSVTANVHCSESALDVSIRPVSGQKDNHVVSLARGDCNLFLRRSQLAQLAAQITAYLEGVPDAE